VTKPATKGKAGTVKVKGKASVKKGGAGAAQPAAKGKQQTKGFKVGGGGAKKGVTKVAGLANKGGAKMKPTINVTSFAAGRGRGGRAVRGGRGGGGRGAGRGAVMVKKAAAPAGKVGRNVATAAAGWTHDLFAGPAAKTNKIKKKGVKTMTKTESFGKSGPLTTGTVVKVTNLKHTVTPADMKELFETMGSLKKMPTLKSGNCTAVFVAQKDARQAVQKYNGVELDGRQMHMTLDKTHGAKKPVQFTVRLN
jgi:hypothetical protein